MVNKGQIHKELGKIFRISSNLIKSDNEMVMEIEKIDILRKMTRRQTHRIKNH